MDNWCHGVLSFDLKIGGIPESHKSNIYNVNFFKEVFNEQPQKKLIATNPQGLKENLGILRSPMKLQSVRLKKSESNNS